MHIYIHTCTMHTVHSCTQCVGGALHAYLRTLGLLLISHAEAMEVQRWGHVKSHGKSSDLMEFYSDSMPY